MSGNVVDLSKFSSNNELNKWIGAILGLNDDSRRNFDHIELVQLLGHEVIKQRVLVESVRNALEKVGNGLVAVEKDAAIAGFALELVNVIDNFELKLAPASPTQ